MELVLRVPKVSLCVVLAATMCWLVLAPGARAQTTISVTTTADDASGDPTACPGSSCSLRDAVAYANSNPDTTVDVPAGTYDLTNGQIQITEPVAIAGQGATPSATQIIQQTTGAGVVQVDSSAGDVSISGVEITGGNVTDPYQAEGGGVLIDPEVTGVSVNLNDDLIDHNTATGGNQTTPGLGGGTAEGGGVAIETAYSPTVVLSDTTVSHNTIQGGTGANGTTGNGGGGGEAYGGGVFTFGTGVLDIEQGSIISDNSATSGSGGTAPADKTVGGAGEAGGAGVFDEGEGSGSVSLTDTIVDGNTATGAPGTGAVSGQANGYGGNAVGAGLDLGQAATLTRVEVDANQGISGPPGTGGTSGSGESTGQGGGIIVFDPTTIEESTIAGNSTSGYGTDGEADGGGVITDAATSVVNTTISGNSVIPEAGARASGGGTFAYGPMTFASDTIVGNQAPANDGANVDAGNSTVKFGGTVVAAPGGGSTLNCALDGGSFSDLPSGRNLEDDAGASCGFSSGAGDQVGADPQLGALQNNGGSTETMLPDPGSPLVGQGGACVDPSTSSPLTVDQRGLPRPSDGPCDVGAVQVQGPANTAAPSLSPTSAGVGQSLACNPGTWSGDGTIGFSYAWLRDGALISGQSGSTYVASATDVGHKVSCRVTANSTYGLNGGPATSNAVSVNASAPTVSINTPSNEASYTKGQAVKASFSCSSPIGIVSCTGTVASGAALDTSSAGSRSFSVTATDAAGQKTTETVHYTVAAIVVSGARESHKVWREHGRGTPPVGTTFKFTLSGSSAVTFTFIRHHHKVTLRLTGHQGTNTFKFKGKLPHGKALAPGKYTLKIAAGSSVATLSFKILT